MENQAVQSESSIQTVRGMHDVLPERSLEFVEIEKKAREIFALFGYREIRTPVLEPLSLFERALGQATDIVEKEIFTLKDRGERTLCLRPEGTAGVVRSLIENHLEKKYPLVKLFYLGPMFRAERPQKGRFREFGQIGSEYFGNESPTADAETIQLVSQMLYSLGIESPEIRLNSIGCSECRAHYKDLLLSFLRKQSSELCQNCQNRIERNPLRALDCKEDSTRLLDAPQIQNYLCEMCSQHHEQVQKLLRSTGVEFKIFPYLVRGLDYYTKTVFEIFWSGKTGSQDALAAGGRYDTLVEGLGGDKIPAVGFALGVERILDQLKENRETFIQNEERLIDVFVAAIGNESIEKSFQILNQLRFNGIRAEGVLNNQSLKSQMRLASSLGSKFCLIIGENELKENVVTFRDMDHQSQKIIAIADLLTVIQKELQR